MKYKEITTWFFAAMCALLISGTANAQRLVLMVDRESGDISATSGMDITVDGYAILSDSGLLDKEKWTSLNSQGLADWVEANPKDTQLAEVTLGSSALSGGDSVSLGNAYRGGPVLPSQEDIRFEYSSGSGSLRRSSVIYTGELPTPKITVDRSSGAVTLTNPGGFAVDGFRIGSASGLLSPDNLGEVPGFTAANPTVNNVSALNLGGAADFPAEIQLGGIYNAAAAAPLAAEDVTLMYSTPDGTVAEGVVDYTGAVNDLTLQVDLLTGAATISHMSTHVGEVAITGYSITSASGALNGDGFTGIGDGFQKANPGPGGVAELNPSATKTFANGTEVAIGNILFNDEDLIFRYSTVDGSAHGSVQYLAGGGGPPSCLDIKAMRVAAGVDGDLDGNGEVAFPDFLRLAAAFNTQVGTYEEGDIDCNGEVGFPDFLTLAANFGNVAQAAEAAAVPEPATGILASLSLLACLCLRRRRS